MTTHPTNLVWDDRPRPGAELMARDAARLQALDADPSTGPSITWFTWDRPTISLGRLQDPALALAPETAATSGVPVVMRPTGGRAVFHIDEWTYSAVVPLDHPVLGGSLARACRAITRVLAEALAEAYGIPARLAGDTGTPGDGAASRRAAPAELSSGACFARGFGHEVVVEDRKLVGSAQRRGTRALLQQGSLLVGPGHERIAHFLEGGGGQAGANALAQGAVTLEELLKVRPDARPFRAAFERRWSAAVVASEQPAQASGQAGARALDSLNARS